MRISEKARQFTVPDRVRALGLYPYFRPIESDQDAEVIIEGRRVLMMGSNNYLGLTNHPEVKAAAVDAIRRYGCGCAGSRFLNGTLRIHLQLEEELAEFIGKEATLLFTAGFLVNQGVISTLVSRNETVVIDRTDHASIIEGCRLAFGRTVKYEHNDMQALERVLKGLNGAGGMVVVDGVFSMEGDVARLPEIVSLAGKYNLDVMVDDAHGLGVMGPGGRGTAAHFGVDDKVDLIMGTFSKSLASIGGFIAGERGVIELLKHQSRALIFAASPPPASVAAVRAALTIIKREPERIRQLWDNTRRLWSGLEAIGLDRGKSETPIVPILIGDDLKAFKVCRRLQEEGVFVNPVVSPAVPADGALIRLSVMATHTFEQVDHAVEKLDRVMRESDLERKPSPAREEAKAK